ncbi:hypothetical protein [Mucilaginibacter ginsenosidivorax]|uniref:Uncharacterized protein n=1 Tax=Mucilaginibacter ginsenosidivorax TaxID=862126 RepID=A0A5B8VX31_9SPHI|nr:hypothetical protein [Mucilaginibacter ginsenosidivorax]QEC75863.1 hypothetical protein FSB76_07850 [Mucilaginibacter ginsenosidivorax]
MAKKEAARKAENDAADKANTERINKIYNGSTKVEYAIPKEDLAGGKKVVMAAGPQIKMIAGIDNVFYNEQNQSEVVLEKDPAWRGISSSSATNSLPIGYGMAMYKDGARGKYTNRPNDFKSSVGRAFNYETYTWDIINIKNQRVFNREDIVEVEHIAGNWFLAGTDFRLAFSNSSSDTKFLYNIKSKQKIEFSQLAYYEGSEYDTASGKNGGPGFYTNEAVIVVKDNPSYPVPIGMFNIREAYNNIFSLPDLSTWVACVVNYGKFISRSSFNKVEFYFILKNGTVVKKNN